MNGRMLTLADTCLWCPLCEDQTSLWGLGLVTPFRGVDPFTLPVHVVDALDLLVLPLDFKSLLVGEDVVSSMCLIWQSQPIEVFHRLKLNLRIRLSSSMGFIMAHRLLRFCYGQFIGPNYSCCNFNMNWLLDKMKGCRMVSNTSWSHRRIERLRYAEQNQCFEWNKDKEKLGQAGLLQTWAGIPSRSRRILAWGSHSL